MCIYCNTITMHRASESLCGECVWVSKWAAQLKTILILVAKWEVPVSKRERLPKRVVTATTSRLHFNSFSTLKQRRCAHWDCCHSPDVTFSSCSFAQQVSSLWSPGEITKIMVFQTLVNREKNGKVFWAIFVHIIIFARVQSDPWCYLKYMLAYKLHKPWIVTPKILPRHKLIFKCWLVNFCITNFSYIVYSKLLNGFVCQ